MHAVNLEAGLLAEMGIERFEQLMADLAGSSAAAADQVVVVVMGNLVGELAVSDMGSQQQALGSQKGQRAVDGSFGDPGHGLAGEFVDFQRDQVAFRLAQDAQDLRALGGHAVALFVQGRSIGIEHEGFLIATNCNKQFYQPGGLDWINVC